MPLLPHTSHGESSTIFCKAASAPSASPVPRDGTLDSEVLAGDYRRGSVLL